MKRLDIIIPTVLGILIVVSIIAGLAHCKDCIDSLTYIR